MDLQVVIGCYGLRNGVMEVIVLFANFSSHQSLIPYTFGSGLLPLQNLKFFKILRHIESLDACMEY